VGGGVYGHRPIVLRLKYLSRPGKVEKMLFFFFILRNAAAVVCATSEIIK
jgi:hypothetical protein